LRRSGDRIRDGIKIIEIVGGNVGARAMSVTPHLERIEEMLWIGREW